MIVALVGLLYNSLVTKQVDHADKELYTLRAVVQFLDKVHYAPKEIDDQLSKMVYQEYLDLLDPAKRFLTAQDISRLEPFKLQIDDEIRNGTFQFFNTSQELMDAGINKAEQYFRDALNNDFSIYTSDFISLDPEYRSFAATDEDLASFWNKVVRYETMIKVKNMMEAQVKTDKIKKDAELLEEAKEKVLSNFEEWFNRQRQIIRADRFADYLNAITIAYDPHSGYFSPKKKQDFEMYLNGTYEGIGARLTQEGELTKVSEIIPGGPAWKQKELEANDYILKVTQESGDGKDVRGWRIDDVVTLIRGPKGTKVILTVKKADGNLVEIDIIRDQVIMEDVKAKSVLIELDGVIDNVGYIRLPKFYFESNGIPGCSDDVAEEIQLLKENEVKGIILDLRTNGGGSLSEVVEMSGLFIEKGPIVQVRPRKSKAYPMYDKDPSVAYHGPLIILVDHFSASASEIIAAALQDYDRAVVVGSNSTFGKGTVQRFHQLDRAIVGNNDLKPFGEIKVTTQKFFRINGGSTQLRGVIPDVILPSPFNYIKMGEREYDSPLEWDEISALSYSQEVLHPVDKQELSRKSAERVAAHPTFMLIEEKALQLKEHEKDDLQYPLHLDAYNKMIEERERENLRFKEIFHPIETLYVADLPSRLSYIQSDSTRIAQSEDFHSTIKNDIYIEESMWIMKNMIDQMPFQFSKN